MTGSSRTTTTRQRPSRWRVVVRGVAALFAALGLVLTQQPAAFASPSSIQHQQWWIERLGLHKVWKISKGQGVTVALIDTGVNASIPDLQGAVIHGFTVGGHGSSTVDHEAEGHGTRLAAYIAGRGRGPGILGIAPAAKVMSIYMPVNSDDTSIVLNRLSAMANPPAVVNMSYGYETTCPAKLQTAVARAVDKGMILVASAGNTGNTDNSTQYPSNCKGVVAVGAFDDNGQAWSDTQVQPYVSLGGPGVDLVGYDRALTIGHSDGTSDSAAMVSGEFAVLKAHFPQLSSRALVARMFATASQSLYHGPGYGKSGDTLGFGPALIHEALIKNVPASAPNPVYDDLAAIAKPGSGGSSTPTSPTSSTPPASSAPPQSPSTAPSSGRQTQDFPTTSSTPAASGSGGGSSTGLVIGIVVAVVVIAGIVLAVALRRRRPGYPPTS